MFVLSFCIEKHKIRSGDVGSGGCSFVVEQLPSMDLVTGSIPSIEKKKKKRVKSHFSRFLKSDLFILKCDLLILGDVCTVANTEVDKNKAGKNN